MPGSSAERGPALARSLSLVWLCCLGGVGFFLPFYGLYLRDAIGLSGAQVGVVTATIPLMGLVGPVLWGHVADRTGRRRAVLALIALGTAAGDLLLMLQDRFAGLVLATALAAAFSSAIVPMSMSVSLALLRDATGHVLGRVRVWGTFGFAACVLGFPWLLELWRGLRGIVPEGPTDVTGLGVMFPCAAAVIATGGLLALRLPRAGAVELRSRPGAWRVLLRSPVYRRMLLFAFLCYLSLQGPMYMLPILVREHGGGVEAVSRMWIWMLALEVPLVAFFGRTVSGFGVRGVIAIGMAAAALRWLVSGYSDGLFWLTAAQLMHGVTVWGVMLGLPLYIDSIVPEQLRSTAQGLMVMLGFSLGSIASNLVAGWLLDVLGPAGPARVGGWMALVAALALPLLLDRRPLRPAG